MPMKVGPYHVTKPKNWLQKVAGLHAVSYESIFVFIGTYTDCCKVCAIANQAYRAGQTAANNYWNP